MPLHILSLPVEILSHILSLLPVRSLLHFSQTSRHSHTMAAANLHTLSLGIAPYRPHLPVKSLSTTSSLYDSWLQIPNPTDYNYNTLSNFQSALVSSLLVRYTAMLQHIDLSIWSLSVPMANALCSLYALQTIALRFDSGKIHGRSVHRWHLAAERAEQRKAWGVLTQSPPVWSLRLRALKLENADLSTEHLGVILAESNECREVVLERCRSVGSEVWDFFRTWRGREKLRGLDLSECGGLLGEEAVMTIGGLRSLERLNLYNCQEGKEFGTVQRWNDDVWRIPQFVPPRSNRQGEDIVIEVDPAYMS